MITLKKYQLILMLMGSALWALALNSCKWNSAHADNVEIKFQTAPDGRQCYMGFQNGELKGMDCSR